MPFQLVVKLPRKKFKQINSFGDPTKVWFLLQPLNGAHLKQFQLYRAGNRFGPTLNIQLGKDVLVVPLDGAQ